VPWLPILLVTDIVLVATIGFLMSTKPVLW
jgi:hypothetical protein